MKDMALLSITRDLLLEPNRLFQKIKQGELRRGIIGVFLFSASVSLAKSFLVERREYISFFENDWLNEVVYMLGIPQVRWFAAHLTFFGVISVAFLLCKHFNERANLGSLVLVFMAPGMIGVLSHLLFYPLEVTVPDRVTQILSIAVFLWCVVLSFRGLRTTQSLSMRHALTAFLVPALLAVLLVGSPGLAPYLSWLDTP